jgi:hypothetical protein
VKPPEIHWISEDSGKGGDKVILGGKFFGTKKGKVYLSYLADGKPQRKRCPVIGWNMDSKTAEGIIIFVVPEDLEPGIYDIIIVNNVGWDAIPAGFEID